MVGEETGSGFHGKNQGRIVLHVIDIPTPAVGPGCSDQTLFAVLDEFGE